ncbi:MAG: hypothetical protein JWR23_3072 [Mucilaginibacter sp.]|nr:hypothetical protein [Mucilaginibacter sp.]
MNLAYSRTLVKELSSPFPNIKPAHTESVALTKSRDVNFILIIVSGLKKYFPGTKQDTLVHLQPNPNQEYNY